MRHLQQEEQIGVSRDNPAADIWLGPLSLSENATHMGVSRENLGQKRGSGPVGGLFAAQAVLSCRDSYAS